MAGLLREEDVALVKERVNLEDVVREHVTLTRSGSDSLKGLCPFHDERSPSFHVRPAHGHWYCFGCGAGGDVIAFVQEIEHLGFVETVERLAARVGVELQRDESSVAESGRARRTRLMEAHRVAEEFYAEALIGAREARPARDFLRGRGFDSKAAQMFGVGYSPRGGDVLTRLLLDRGFTEEELTLGGLTGRSSRGLYDRFRGRVMWPIRDVTGATVGFGARRILDDDRIDAKYLNTSETPIYKKTHVLYGLDLAKKAIASQRRAVVVEGYTDVMAMHLSGVRGAVATCGTSFGAEHVKVLRRLLRDDGDGKVIFTFDGDAAGQKAAMRAYELDDQWVSQSFVAVARNGMDPCDLRLAEGEAAVEHLIEKPTPMFEFAARTTIGRFDLQTREGQAHAIEAVAPILAGIDGEALSRMYVDDAATWIGVPVDLVAGAVERARAGGRRPDAQVHGGRQRVVASGGEVSPVRAESGPDANGESASLVFPRPDLRNRVVHLEFQVLQVLLQYPGALDDSEIMPLVRAQFTDPGLAAVLLAVLTHWGEHTSVSASAWVELVRAQAGDQAGPTVSSLVVTPLLTRLDPQTGLPSKRFVQSLLVAVQEETLRSRIAAAAGDLRRAEAMDPQRARYVAQELTALQGQLAALKHTED
ncbi:DNA primase [Dermatophilus congolensis]|uniref:DNA primase n=1 Tax=Dermatophilus congolensis TaxID=1863 RepID=A0A239VJU7_9MICO|nr:DNA primase [Dermatophilus congolensis]SNV22487.1 DNA primase [Dermatophilus congolensis]